MSLAQDHRVTIERRGRSHKCVCSCGWASHAWNELRPAEADAWHHVYGDEAIVDVTSIPDERSVPALGSARAEHGPGADTGSSREVEQLVRKARDLAARPSPYTRESAPELWRQAAGSRTVIQAAISELVELLARHDRHSAGAADSEWLQLITAKRLLADAMEHDEGPVSGLSGRAFL